MLDKTGELSATKENIVSELILDPRATAIVVIDLQKGIVALPGNPHTTVSVVANSVRLLDAARAAGAQPVLVHVNFSADRSDALKQPIDEPMRTGGTMPPDWSELVPELNRQPSDIVILKRQWGAFYGTDLDLQLRRRGLKTIVLCGIATEVGVESTARDAYERGYELVLAEDAMTGRSSHANSVAHIFPRLGRVRSTDEIVAALNGK
jgi:nicotinamidase-related amidase